jgi:predicted dithiol-disulfide oxidoreductase (DUF899 family)
MSSASFEKPLAVSPEKWLAARRELLREEKDLLRQRDRLAAKRRTLPWMKVDRNYVFASPAGPITLAGLFEDRRQLIVYHFMLAPGWDEGCRGCSFVSDHFDGTLAHLGARDVAFTAVTSAPVDQIERFKARMGWKFNWVSSNGTTFNRDFGVAFTPEQVAAGEAEYNFGSNYIGDEEMPGLSVFARDTQGEIYRTYSTYARGLDLLIGTYNLLDLVPRGRDEDPETPMKWIRHHDAYAHVTASR